MTAIERSVYPFLVFKGNAEEAMQFYVSSVPNSKIISIIRFSKSEIGEEGKVLTGIFSLCGQQYIAMDMEEKYSPKLSWAFSFYFECMNEAEFDLLFVKLSENGTVIMGPEPVQSEQVKIRKGTWFTDKFGVTWQLIWK